MAAQGVAPPIRRRLAAPTFAQTRAALKRNTHNRTPVRLRSEKHESDASCLAEGPISGDPHRKCPRPRRGGTHQRYGRAGRCSVEGVASVTVLVGVVQSGWSRRSENTQKIAVNRPAKHALEFSIFCASRHSGCWLTRARIHRKHYAVPSQRAPSARSPTKAQD